MGRGLADGRAWRCVASASPWSSQGGAASGLYLLPPARAASRRGPRRVQAALIWPRRSAGPPIFRGGIADVRRRRAEFRTIQACAWFL